LPGRQRRGNVKTFRKMEPMSKAEEIEVFRAFVGALPDPSYLKAQLTGLDMVLKAQMDNDIVEPIDEIVAGQNKKFDSLLIEATGYKVTNQTTLGMLKRRNEEVAEFRATIERMEKEWNGLEQTAEGYRADLEAEGDKHIKSRLDLIAREREIIELKAKLYDKAEAAKA
jgi:hypothetical protein